MWQILIVDDDPDSRAMLILLFKNSFQCIVTEAESAKKAAIIIRKKNFHLIITDFHMSNDNGLDLLKFLQQQRATTPLILFTATELDISTLDFPFVALIAKPKVKELLICAKEKLKIQKKNS